MFLMQNFFGDGAKFVWGLFVHVQRWLVQEKTMLLPYLYERTKQQENARKLTFLLEVFGFMWVIHRNKLFLHIIVYEIKISKLIFLDRNKRNGYLATLIELSHLVLTIVPW